MPYVIDASCIIQAKNFWYPPDFHPGYWDWLDRQNAEGSVYSTKEVKAELLRGVASDPAKLWAKAKGDEFFLSPDEQTVERYAEVAKWANAAGFRREGVAEFPDCADPWIVACAAARNYAVVSHERSTVNMNEVRRIRPARACGQFHIAYISLFDAIRASGVRFVHE